MATSLYDLSVPTFLQTVRAVAGFLQRAAKALWRPAAKSAKARNRGQWCSGGAAGAMGIWPRGMA